MFERYAIYYTPEGDFARHGAAWLGWDVDRGQAAAHPALDGLDLARLTATPRTYGFHGTLKAPFRLSKDADAAGLEAAVARLAAETPRALAEGLTVTALGRFLALTPTGDTTAIKALAAHVVRTLDSYRAPLTEAEVARRRRSNLSPAQEENLHRWGYPHVMDQFRFHMTLTGRMPRGDIGPVLETTQRYFASISPKPFVLEALTLVGQQQDRMFRTIKRFALA